MLGAGGPGWLPTIVGRVVHARNNRSVVTEADWAGFGEQLKTIVLHKMQMDARRMRPMASIELAWLSGGRSMSEVGNHCT
jgi:hypothetical protein